MCATALPHECSARAAAVPAARGADVRAVARDARGDANMAKPGLPLQADDRVAPGDRRTAGTRAPTENLVFPFSRSQFSILLMRSKNLLKSSTVQYTEYSMCTRTDTSIPNGKDLFKARLRERSTGSRGTCST